VLSEEQIGAIYRGGVIADKHSETLKRLMQDEVDLSEELVEAARRSAESAGHFYELAEEMEALRRDRSGTRVDRLLAR
jgi:hypothetical protein